MIKPTRRELLALSASGLAGLSYSRLFADEANSSAAGEIKPPVTGALRACFFTDAHLPYEDTLARVPNDKFHHQERIRVAFDKANAFTPEVYIFGGDNVFAVDQANDGGNLEDNARGQFENWKKVVHEKVTVPHHSVIGNHDIWMSPPAGQDRKALAIAGFEMPGRYYSWSQRGWKFLMLDVFGISGSPLDKEQWDWLQQEIKTELPTCIVTHAPILGTTVQLVGGGIGSIRAWRELFYAHPNVRLALSGHNHMVDCCQLDRVTYLCGGAVSGGWWEKDYERFPAAFVILDLHPTGKIEQQVVFYESGTPNGTGLISPERSRSD